MELPRYSYITAVTVAAFSLCQALPAEASIAVQGEQATAEYWTTRQPEGEKILMDQKAIKDLNRTLRARNETLRDLAAFPATLTSQQVKNRIYAAMQDYWPGEKPSDVYVGSHILTAAEWDYVRQNCNADNLPETVTIQYGVTTQRGDIRLLPTSDGWYSAPGDVHYDNLQGTAIDPAQAVAVLAVSKDGNFYFVQSSDYQGWLESSKVALTDYKTWLTFAQPQDFVVVISNKKEIQASGGPKALYQMGATIPCHKDDNGRLAMQLPLKNAEGRLELVNTPVQLDNTLHQGYLPYSYNNTICQAFRFLGDVYGWGGQDESVDCSSFVQNVYRSMGIHIPRDADQQEAAMPVNRPFAGLSTTERYNEVKQAKPGALCFKPGHVMMYLGQNDNGVPMVIHSASSYYDYKVDAQKHYIRQVIVSDLTYQNSQGTQTIDGTSSIGSIK
ncbi:SH3 domain (SH3b1 type) [Selenomonas sp. GACV-9]|uniref:NlpC/P60 family protein n=1 Tax=Selenomonas sp. GACV-9 TaxID=3158782 RepID=UPI0008E7A8BF|nr:SH3 domain (SH3b1 type) [Selenomonas ruminantium]